MNTPSAPPSAANNTALNAAARARNDEFYTQLPDIEAELRHYPNAFRGKTVYCNCDDPRVSAFWHYFSHQFHHLGLKRLLATCYKNQNPNLFSRHDTEQAIMLDYDGFRTGETTPRPEDIGIKTLHGDGDFRSDECIALLQQADIVVTNPPFSLFREYVAQLVEHKKQFLIIGNVNAITYREVFPLIRENRVWLGYTGITAKAYKCPDGDIKKMGNTCWFTNLPHHRRKEKLILYRPYTPQDYPTYDNYDAIEVSKVANIPADYDGVMGVPITFLDKYNPDQFEILGATESEGRGFAGDLYDPTSGIAQAMAGGRRVFKRLFIRKRRHAGA
ncbi:MAG: adenine-specific methyltransferase EcoRI family protein [Rhodobacteraceae bacterium]|nr:adenine-specific methyltransferase EcoRI family protein [Paracoccaceae bacterium]